LLIIFKAVHIFFHYTVVATQRDCLNLVDYYVWNVIYWSSAVSHTHIHDMIHLKACLVEEWQKFDQKIIDRAIKQWRLH